MNVCRYWVSLGGTRLDTLLDKDYKDAVLVTDIQYAKPDISKTIETPGDLDGGLITRKYRQKASVTITFLLRIYDTAKRNKACQAVKTWASKGGVLRTSDRSDQVLLYSVCDEYPEIDSAKNWLDPLTMTFSSYTFPYWQDATESTITISGSSSSSGSITIPGNAPRAYTTIKATVTQGSIKGLSVTFNGAWIIVGAQKASDSLPSGASLVRANEYLLFDHDNDLHLRINHMDKDGKFLESWLPYRYYNSADELFATPGKSNSLKFTAVSSASAYKVSLNLKARGAWL